MVGSRSHPLRWLLFAAALGILAGRLLLPSGPKVGQSPPADLSLPLLEGGEARLADLRGKIVVLDFWATWCPPCVESLPTLGRVTREFAGRDLVTLAVNRDDGPNREAKVRAFLERRGLADLAVALDDGRAAGALNVRAFPTLVVLDREGRVAMAHVGAMDEGSLRELLSSALEL
jgi:thiol-disulfide isomerase/thioredoxin